MTDIKRGILAMIGACSIWGLSPIYYKVLDTIPPLELLAHRTVWSLVFFLGILVLQGRIRVLSRLLGSANLGWVAIAAVLISINWFLFIYAIQVGRALEASLGYYVFPLIAVCLGVALFKERLSRPQALAVGLAGFAVAVLIFGLGAAPWFALTLAVSFAFYGVVKKRLDAGPMVSVTGEVAILFPIAIIWLLGVHFAGWTGLGGTGQGIFGQDAITSALLAFSGPLTATPLILFSYASRRVPMRTVGLVGYLNPTLQFLCATLIFAEPFTGWHAIAFALIWAALALYTLDAWRQDRAARRAASTAALSGTTSM